jgi:formate dehydrogenase subunit gamma
MSGSRSNRRAVASIPAEPDVVLRFRTSERQLHWSIAIPFMVCYATALILWFVYNPDPQRPYREIFLWVHRISGFCLLLFPMVTLLRNRRDYRIHLSNIRQAWIWTGSDIKWLGLMGLAAVSKRFQLPEQGKFNAAEKINFMMVMTTYPLYIVTGILLWLPGIAFYSWLIHVAMAALATPLLFGHVFMATVNPDTRVGLEGMVSGFVDRDWARHHYGIWYRETFEKLAEAVPGVEPVSDGNVTRVHLGCGVCNTHPIPVHDGFMLGELSAMETAPCPSCSSDLDSVTIIAEPDALEWILEQLHRGGAGFIPTDGAIPGVGGGGEPVAAEISAAKQFESGR